MTTKKVGFILCVCTGDCPGFAKMNVWDVLNQVRLVLPVEWAILHPQLCEEDGDRFMEELVKLVQTSKLHYFIAGCSPNMQRKLLGHAFKKEGLDFKEWVYPLDVRNMTTEEVFDTVEKKLEDWGVADE